VEEDWEIAGRCKEVSVIRRGTNGCVTHHPRGFDRNDCWRSIMFCQTLVIEFLFVVDGRVEVCFCQSAIPASLPVCRMFIEECLEENEAGQFFTL